jgi:mRNA-degrading endonuclease toxin of MazEF toxin-antitoxin module
MKIPRPEPGLVIRYGFLWAREDDAGRKDPAKARPSAIVTAVEQVKGATIVTVVPITTKPPLGTGRSVELPPDVKRMLGLDDQRSWIVTDELNSFNWPGPDIEPTKPGSSSIVYGRLPRGILAATLRSALEHVRTGRARVVRRTE